MTQVLALPETALEIPRKIYRNEIFSFSSQAERNPVTIFKKNSVKTKILI